MSSLEKRSDNDEPSNEGDPTGPQKRHLNFAGMRPGMMGNAPVADSK